METRVIVAGNARARVFSSHTTIKQLTETEAFVHPEASWSEQDINADARGQSRHPHGSLDPSTPPTEHEAHNFARLLARHLKEMHNQQHYEQLILIAAPRFLGLLRKELHPSLSPLVSLTIDKELCGASPEEIIDYIQS